MQAENLHNTAPPADCWHPLCSAEEQLGLTRRPDELVLVIVVLIRSPESAGERPVSGNVDGVRLRSKLDQHAAKVIGVDERRRGLRVLRAGSRMRGDASEEIDEAVAGGRFARIADCGVQE